MGTFPQGHPQPHALQGKLRGTSSPTALEVMRTSSFSSPSYGFSGSELRLSPSVKRLSLV